MRVSVIIPCHNAGKTIGATLQSIAAQTKPPHEVIVIDDGSTDDSRAQIEKSGVPVKLLESSFRNAAGTRNVGIEAATGDWIAFLDADDLWMPGHLERAAALLERGAAVAFMANHQFLSDAGTSEIPADMRARLGGEPVQSRSDLTHLDYIEMARTGFHFGHSTVLMQRARVLEVGLFDVSQKRRHDMDLWLRVLAGKTWAYESDVAAQYRVDTPGSISKSVVECEYFYLRALLKNRENYPGDAMTQIVGDAARKLMSLSFVDGQNADFSRAKSLAWPLLSPRHRVFYGASSLCRPLFQAAIRAKRAWVWRNVKAL